MALITEYNESDAYITEDEYNDLTDEDKEYVNIGYDELMDNDNWDFFTSEVKEAFEKRKFPLVLRANNSNWQGQTGYAKCDNVDEVISKLTSFDSSYYKPYSSHYKLCRTRGGALHFQLATHDVPTGFTIDIKPYNPAYWDN